MPYDVNLLFADKQLEKRFAKLIADNAKEEIGGVMFWQWNTPNHIHWRTCQRLFGAKHLGIISDWIVVPNVSNLRDREYSVSDFNKTAPLILIGWNLVSELHRL